MVVSNNDAFLEQLIQNQRRAIRYYVLFAAGLVTLGIVVITIAFVSPFWLDPKSPIIPDTFKGLFGMGGAFVSSLSAFQVKEILNRKEKIQAFETIKVQMQNLKSTPKSKREDSQKRLEELIWKVLEKTALS
ncbi:MAG: hypothetical protein HOP27_12635 [Anaerolineales bacterium]|nr:hypothetical protein [Anaerolineales bacterium]